MGVGCWKKEIVVEIRHIVHIYTIYIIIYILTSTLLIATLN